MAPGTLIQEILKASYACVHIVVGRTDQLHFLQQDNIGSQLIAICRSQNFLPKSPLKNLEENPLIVSGLGSQHCFMSSAVRFSLSQIVEADAPAVAVTVTKTRTAKNRLMTSSRAAAVFHLPCKATDARIW